MASLIDPGFLVGSRFIFRKKGLSIKIKRLNSKYIIKYADFHIRVFWSDPDTQLKKRGRIRNLSEYLDLF